MKKLLCLLVLATALSANAQNTVAIQSYSFTDFGYATGTAGWTFQTLTNVSVTALGCFNYIVCAQGPVWIGLWAEDGTLLATNNVSTNSALADQARYEPINPVLLFTNQTYYLGAFSPSGYLGIEAFASWEGFGYVNLAPEIQLSSAVTSTNMSFGFPETMQGGITSAFLAPNFQFQDGIVFPVLNVALASNDMLMSWSATYPNLVLQENDNLTTTNWMTITNPIVQAGGQNQVLILSPGGNNFYRLVSQ